MCMCVCMCVFVCVCVCMCVCVFVCVCVITGLLGLTVWPNYEVLFQASVSDCSNPRLYSLFSCVLPSPSRFSNPHHSHHTCSSLRLCIPCLRPSIYYCHTGNFPTWVSLISVPEYWLPTQTSSPFWLPYYYMSISLLILLLLLASHEYDRVAQSFFLLPLGATTPSSSMPLLCTLSPVHLPQIRDVVPLTASRLPVAALCKY